MFDLREILNQETYRPPLTQPKHKKINKVFVQRRRVVHERLQNYDFTGIKYFPASDTDSIAGFIGYEFENSEEVLESLAEHGYRYTVLNLEPILSEPCLVFIEKTLPQRDPEIPAEKRLYLVIWNGNVYNNPKVVSTVLDPNPRVADLKMSLKLLGRKVSGTKDELIKRIKT